VLNLAGLQATGPAKVSQLTAPGGAPPPPAAPGTGRFGGPPVKVSESTLPQAPGRVTLPPMSITVYRFEVK